MESPMKLSNKILTEIGLQAALVHEALTRLGDGHHRVTHIKKAMRKPICDSLIKKAIAQLVAKQFIARQGDVGDPRGYFYKID